MVRYYKYKMPQRSTRMKRDLTELQSNWYGTRLDAQLSDVTYKYHVARLGDLYRSQSEYFRRLNVSPTRSQPNLSNQSTTTGIPYEVQEREMLWDQSLLHKRYSPPVYLEERAPSPKLVEKFRAKVKTQSESSPPRVPQPAPMVQHEEFPPEDLEVIEMISSLWSDKDNTELNALFNEIKGRIQQKSLLNHYGGVEL